jgi:hypothetical protein
LYMRRKPIDLPLKGFEEDQEKLIPKLLKMI